MTNKFEQKHWKDIEYRTFFWRSIIEMQPNKKNEKFLIC